MIEGRITEFVSFDGTTPPDVGDAITRESVADELGIRLTERLAEPTATMREVAEELGIDLGEADGDAATATGITKQSVAAELGIALAD